MAIENTDPGLTGNNGRPLSTPTQVSGAEPKPRPSEVALPGKFQKVRPQRAIFWLRPATSAPTIEALPGASAQALVSEIEVCAARFAKTGEHASIDLGFLKSMPEERATLAGLLGKGEVAVVVDSLGRTEIQETSVSCIWWIRHQNSGGETVGESIEITDIPDLIVGDREAVVHGLEALRAALPFRARSLPIAPPFSNAR